MQDAIKHPDHYEFRGGIEPIDYIMSNRLEHAEACIVKYVYRWPRKNGLQDLLKARRYLDLLIARETAQETGQNCPPLNAAGQ